MTAVAGAVALSGSIGGGWPVALGRALMVAVPVAVGLFVWQRSSYQRFGVLMVATGAVLFLSTLAESEQQLPYSIGRVGGFIPVWLFTYLHLAFPAGRLGTRADMLLTWTAGALLVALFIAPLPVEEAFPDPSPFSSCDRDCPRNAFFVAGGEPPLLDGVIRPLRETLTILLICAVVVRLAQRSATATPLMRRTLFPALVASAVWLAAVTAMNVIRLANGGDPPMFDIFAWLLALTGPLLALGFLLGLLRRRLSIAGALQRLAVRLGERPDPEGLRLAFADAFVDPDVAVLFPVNGGWIDAAGAPVRLPVADSGRCVTRVLEDGAVLAALVHDCALRDEDELVGAASSLATMALGNQRLAAEVEASARELRHSRARIAQAADRERRRIERDLHDSAQQRLVALRIQLELAEDLVRGDPEQGAARLHELVPVVDEALEEIRRLARGIYPPLLADLGLADALRAATADGPVEVRFQVEELGRYPADVESAVYFSVLEALQNVAKHAGTGRATVLLSGGDGPRFAVSDEGAGFPDDEREIGVGIANMRDRLAAIDGDLWIDSSPGRGTKVRGRVPAGRCEGGPPGGRATPPQAGSP